MANIGLKYPCYAILDANTYSGGTLIGGGAITANVNITKNDVKLYADDAVKETDQSVTGGTISGVSFRSGSLLGRIMVKINSIHLCWVWIFMEECKIQGIP